MSLSAPFLFTSSHNLEDFQSGSDALDFWLKQRALKNQETGATRTYVVFSGDTVIAYYALASSSIALVEANGNFRRNMPDPMSVVVLARLAVDVRYQGRGLGRAMVRDAAKRVLHAATLVGIRGMIVHALTENARQFYERVGFRASPLHPFTLMITVRELAESL